MYYFDTFTVMSMKHGRKIRNWRLIIIKYLHREELAHVLCCKRVLCCMQQKHYPLNSVRPQGIVLIMILRVNGTDCINRLLKQMKI